MVDVLDDGRRWRRPLLDLYPRFGPRRLRRLPEGWDPFEPTRLRLSPCGPLIGAEVDGVDLRGALDDALVAELDRALVEWKVLVFHDQHLTGPDVDRVAGRWGEIFEAALFPTARTDAQAARATAPYAVTGGWQNYWHVDDTFRPVPSMATVLCVAEAPLGGDTLFADMAAAYDNLSDDVKARIDGLRAVHHCHDYAEEMYGERFDEVRASVPPVTHPVVRTHPVTGRRTIFVNAAWTASIEGLPRDEGDALLLHLTAQATVPEYQVRVRWRSGSVVIWDNRAVQHYAVSDYATRRVMVRASIAGDVPV